MALHAKCSMFMTSRREFIKTFGARPFVLYVQDGNIEKADETLEVLETAIPDMPPQYVTNMIESALHGARNAEYRFSYRLDEGGFAVLTDVDPKPVGTFVVPHEIEGHLVKRSATPKEEIMKTKICMIAIAAAVFPLLCGCATNVADATDGTDGACERGDISMQAVIEEITVLAVGEALYSKGLVRKDGFRTVIALGEMVDDTMIRFDADKLAGLVRQAAFDSGRALIVERGDVRLPPSATMDINITQRDRDAGDNHMSSEFIVKVRVVDIASGEPVVDKRRIATIMRQK